MLLSLSIVSLRCGCADQQTMEGADEEAALLLEPEEPIPDDPAGLVRVFELGRSFCCHCCATFNIHQSTWAECRRPWQLPTCANDYRATVATVFSGLLHPRATASGPFGPVPRESLPVQNAESYGDMHAVCTLQDDYVSALLARLDAAQQVLPATFDSVQEEKTVLETFWRMVR